MPQHGSRDTRDGRGLVADAEQEILNELAEFAASEAQARDPGTRDTVMKVTAILLLSISIGLTWTNLDSREARATEIVRAENDALEALELFAGDIEAYRAASGAYPRVFDNPFDDPSWSYERLADDHFRLEISREDGVLAYDSREGRARREHSTREG